ncbi:uncharacterized protein LOC100832868 [Brachypodium distachyon]|uniref:Uncharacterized protein n=1 Tax=Brachypodium distachyon TaxID=15368 RepID=I1HY89_BRADI|nr:uncharacterized protein LOC100832868 [Brachypodium distachyon]KQJ93803.1 hypothetical protein BRADI_3g06830v3 [Brachypodium distachyon]|eukprot:XP_010233963.1 uncharacterized protein LOC100832868 [Brachypodium distachyon]
MQDPRGTPREDFSGSRTHKRKVVYRSLPSDQIKTETELLRREVPHLSAKMQKPPKRSFKSEHRPPTLQSDRGTPDSLPDSGPADEYRALRRKYLLLEEENYTLDTQLGVAEEEAKTLEDEKFALLDQLVVLEGLVDPSQLQPQRRL